MTQVIDAMQLLTDLQFVFRDYSKQQRSLYRYCSLLSKDSQIRVGDTH